MAKEVDKSGFWLIKKNPISKVGVFPYLGAGISDECEPNKVYYVYRPESTLVESVPTWDNPPKPFIDDHEMLGDGFTAVDDRPVQGVIYNPVYENGVLYADIGVYSEELKDQINNGKKELSLGYFCNFKKQRGVYNGEVYDYVQTDMVGNHIALVDAGRCGSDVKVYDSKYAIDKLDIKEFVCGDAEFREEDHPRDEDGKFTNSGSTGNRTYLNVPYSEKDYAKSQGAKWDAERKKWYIPEGVTGNFDKWIKNVVSSSKEFETKNVPLKDSNKKIAGFDVSKETDKAFFLQKDGVSFWCPKSWIKKDGSLSKKAEIQFEIAQINQETKKDISLLKEKGVNFEKSWENENAIGVDVEIEFHDLEKDKKVRLFFPKKLLQENGNIPYWLYEQKLNELYDNMRNKGGFTIMKTGFKTNERETSEDSVESILFIENGKIYETAESGLNKNQENDTIKSTTTGSDAMADKVDKREAIRKIMAIAAKPNSDFEGGEEEKIETIAKLLENSEYAKSEAGTSNDEDDMEKKSEDEEEKEEEKKSEDKCGKDEDIRAADIMAWLKQISETLEALVNKKAMDEEEEEKKSEDEDEEKESEDEDEEKKAEDSFSVTFSKDSAIDGIDPAIAEYLK